MVTHGAFFPKDEYIKEKTAKILLQLSEHFQNTEEIFKLSFRLLYEELSSLPEKERITQEFSHALEMIGLLTNLEELAKHTELLPANTYQEFLGISNETLLWMYKVGHKFYEEKNFDNASAIFRLVVQLNPLVYDYWTAFAFAQLNQNKPEDALHSFASAIYIDPEGPVARYQSSKIYLSLGKTEDALIELEVLENIANTNNRESLKPLIEELKAQITR